MAGNKTSRRCWAYQTAVGTEAIDDATDTTYLFGHPDDTNWKVPKIATEVDPYYTYSSREPTLTPLKPEYKTFTVPFYPTTAQYLAWQLKQVTEDEHGANVHGVSVLDSGLPLPLTIRYEMNDGSVDRLFQAVDCYSIGLTCSAIDGQPFLVENEFAFGRLEDRRGQWLFDDICASRTANTITLTDDADRTANSLASHLCYINGGDHEDAEYNITANTDADPTVLTTTETTGASLAGDTLSVWDKVRPKLTTVPVMCGEAAPNAYMGTPKVYWDATDQNVNLTECWSAVWQHNQNYSQVLDSDSKYATTYLFNQNPIIITLDMICERHKQVYDYIDRKANTIEVYVYKPDTTYYIEHEFSNGYIVDWIETGESSKGHYNAKVLIKAESCIGKFVHEDETSWDTHYKHVT